MDSVMMTSSGFISPAREGRLPDALRPAVSALATASLPQDIDSATPPGTPTPPPFNQDHMSSNVSSSTTISPKKRGPVPGSRHKRKRDATPHKLVNPDDSPDDLSGDETYEPPPGTILDDKSSSKKLSVFQRKVKPRKQSPTKSADTLNTPKDSTPNYSEGHVDDVIRKVIERGIEESARLQPSPKSLLSQQKGAKGTAITDNPTVPGPPPGVTRSSWLPTHTQTLSPAAMSKQQPVTSPGPKKRGRKRKSELLKMEAEKAAQDASKSESSDIDICYDAPIRKKQKPPIQTALSIAQPPIELKIPQAPTLPPDASILLNNPLIPKVPYGFGDFSNFNVPSIMQSEDTAKITSSERESSGLRSFKSGDSSLVGIGFGNNQAKDSFPFDKHERKKDKIGKKSKKDKKEKDKNKGRDKNKDKDKLKEKKDKDKGKEKDKEKSKGKRDRNKELKREKKREEKERLREEKRERKREEKEKDKKDKKKKKLMKLPTVQMPPLFAPAEEVLHVVQSQPSVPKIKIKDIKPDEKPTKIVFKNVPGEQQQYPGSNMQVNILKHSTLKPHGPADSYVNVNINPKDKKQKSSKKKEKSVDLHYPQEVEPLKLNKKNIKQDKRERVSSGDIAKRKIRDAPVFTHGLPKPDYIDVEPGASSSNSPQISGISSPSSFVGGGTITTQTVGKYVDQGNIEIS